MSASPTSLPLAIICTITTAIAPVAPDIIPGLPPNKAVTIPIIKAPYKPTKGSIPATKANATASGTSANATVSPDSISFLGFSVKVLNILLVIMVDVRSFTLARR